MQKLNLVKNVLVLSALSLFVMSCESHDNHVIKETKTEVVKPVEGDKVEKTVEKEIEIKK